MGTRKKFTAEEIQVLSANPYTLTITENRISFTVKAKQIILEQYEAGKVSARFSRTWIMIWIFLETAA